MAAREYPRWKYHFDFEPYLVHSEAEEKKLGPGWTDAPEVETAPAAPAVKPGPQRKQKAP